MVESKPDSAAQDLRFHAPWPQLQALAQSIDLATLNDIDHKHVPYGAPGCAGGALGLPRLGLDMSLWSNSASACTFNAHERFGGPLIAS